MFYFGFFQMTLNECLLLKMVWNSKSVNKFSHLQMEQEQLQRIRRLS